MAISIPLRSMVFFDSFRSCEVIEEATNISFDVVFIDFAEALRSVVNSFTTVQSGSDIRVQNVTPSPGVPKILEHQLVPTHNLNS